MSWPTCSATAQSRAVTAHPGAKPARGDMEKVLDLLAAAVAAAHEEARRIDQASGYSADPLHASAAAGEAHAAAWAVHEAAKEAYLLALPAAWRALNWAQIAQ